MKKIISLIIVLIIAFSAFSFSVSAATYSSVSVSSTSPKVGTTLTVTVSVSDSVNGVDGIQGILTYDTNKLRFADSSNDNAQLGAAGTVRIINQDSSCSVKFTTIGVGNLRLYFKDVFYVPKQGPQSSEEVPVETSYRDITVTDNKSDNANLSYIRVSKGTLSPKFNKNTTSYSVLVGNTVQSCVVTANQEDNNAKISITGSDSLKVGKNTRTITVTAQSGKTKVYTVVITRSKESDASSDSSNSSEGTSSSTEEKNPLEAELGGETYTVVTETTEKPIPAGFVENKVKYNEIEVKTAKTEDGKMELYFLKNNDTGAVDYYLLDDETKTFKLLSYFTINNKMYIVSKEGMKGTVEGYYKTNVNLGNTSVEAFTSLDERLSDFYIIYCFTDGKYGYYSYDMAEATIQRMPTFKAAFKPQKETEEKQTSATPFFAKIAKSISNIGKLPLMGKIVIAAIIVVILCIIALIVMLIIKFIPKKDIEDLEEDNDAIFDEVHFETSSIDANESDSEE